mmetsp:Transcript_11117/g.21458  ORF Transcript_11117/g.21458 Transcript_11117/m.21458 type:complete len:448 (+) Transcript_11117:41-1384(+)
MISLLSEATAFPAGDPFDDVDELLAQWRRNRRLGVNFHGDPGVYGMRDDLKSSPETQTLDQELSGTIKSPSRGDLKQFETQALQPPPCCAVSLGLPSSGVRQPVNIAVGRIPSPSVSSQKRGANPRCSEKEIETRSSAVERANQNSPSTPNEIPPHSPKIYVPPPRPPMDPSTPHPMPTLAGGEALKEHTPLKKDVSAESSSEPLGLLQADSADGGGVVCVGEWELVSTAHDEELEVEDFGLALSVSSDSDNEEPQKETTDPLRRVNAPQPEPTPSLTQGAPSQMKPRQSTRRALSESRVPVGQGPSKPSPPSSSPLAKQRPRLHSQNVESDPQPTSSKSLMQMLRAAQGSNRHLPLPIPSPLAQLSRLETPLTTEPSEGERETSANVRRNLGMRLRQMGVHEMEEVLLADAPTRRLLRRLGEIEREIRKLQKAENRHAVFAATSGH